MKDYYQKLLTVLALHSDEREARAEAFFILEEAFGVSRTDIYAGKVRKFSTEEQCRFNEIIKRVGEGVPVQYAVGHTWFRGIKIMVNPYVLIPRPETEELVGKVVATCKNKVYNILDAGTGSGCIAIALKKELAQCHITACDISTKALATAKSNAEQLGLNIVFEQHDLLNFSCENPYDVIVSNPPYVCESEKAEMQHQVVDYEPHTAFFVSDNNPLVFYKALAEIGKTAKYVFCELNAALSDQTKFLFEKEGYKHVRLETDMFGKNRFLTAQYRE